MYNAVIFDKDGTLMNTDKLWNKVYREAIAILAENYGLDLDFDKVMLSIGIIDDNLKKDSLASIGSVKEVLDEIIKSYSLDIDNSSMEYMLESFEKTINEKVKENIKYVELLHTDILHMLKYLVKNQIVIGLVTTDSKKNTMGMLEYLGLKDYFYYIGCGDDLELKSKPEVDHGIHFMKDLSLSPSSVLMVGDSSYDELFAEKLGVDFHKITIEEDIYDLYCKLKTNK
ncbi:HAD family hydrolase [Clostridium grantii]|uniref:Phosphoglycolate phosphatase, HAD superfamily n=1 Tax=Clostridium grantii DSM 8605 TaxID=1121316 RepID=A0A1M5S5D6_9CLOT|nr:HAD hydrolase-like protein [Clostridium grantii]SHH33640.1 Phosphoglycolate phosphatase, HAD superfamily [Clostridium grantii DSM 8605]